MGRAWWIPSFMVALLAIAGCYNDKIVKSKSSDKVMRILLSLGQLDLS